MTYSGAGWVKESFKIENMSPIGEAVANLLGDLFGGIYHLETKDLKAVEWSNPHCIEFVLRDKDLSTFDFGELTRFVILCHDYAIRGSVEAKHRRQFLLTFHQRKREGRTGERHPTIEQALEMYRKYHPVTAAELTELQQVTE